MKITITKKLAIIILIRNNILKYIQKDMMLILV